MSLIEKFSNSISGVLHGFDRIVFQGFIQPLMYPEGAMKFFNRQRILYKDAKSWVIEQTAKLVDSVEQLAIKTCGQGITYLPSSNDRKESIARERQAQTGIETGLIGVWSCVEAGGSYRIIPAAGKPALRWVNTRCKHLYLYMDHPVYGFMHIRIQTWFPYKIQVAMNGREWLARQLKTVGIGFERHRNKFLHVDDFAQAQNLLTQQLDSQWCKIFDGLLPQAFPTMSEVLGSESTYTWNCWQSEWATDLVFHDPKELIRLMDALVRHAFISGHAGRLLRYFGRPVNRQGDPRTNFNGAIQTRIKDLHEGVRIRHWVNHNSVKLYNEHNNLRIETTINRPCEFRVHRHKQGADPSEPKQRLPLRKGVADLRLRALVSQDVNNRLADHLATTQVTTPLSELLDPITCAKRVDGRRVRAIDPLGKDRHILKAIADPQFAVAGFTNKTIRALLAAISAYVCKTDKQLSGIITRLFRMLRDHGLIRKLPKQNRYLMTSKGRQITTAIQAVLTVSTQELMAMAA